MEGFVEILFGEGSSLAGEGRTARYRRPCVGPRDAIRVICLYIKSGTFRWPFYSFSVYLFVQFAV
jgi:hypothetical protein